MGPTELYEDTSRAEGPRGNLFLVFFRFQKLYFQPNGIISLNLSLCSLLLSLSLLRLTLLLSFFHCKDSYDHIRLTYKIQVNLSRSLFTTAEQGYIFTSSGNQYVDIFGSLLLCLPQGPCWEEQNVQVEQCHDL